METMSEGQLCGMLFWKEQSGNYAGRAALRDAFLEGAVWKLCMKGSFAGWLFWKEKYNIYI